ncbi:MAG: sigma-70 family RNA polymerase sigma factor [Chloroflexi bacterium]|nr:sigma-70 family RNA polymerase sigma factor [Chloroflexota bacterium]
MQNEETLVRLAQRGDPDAYGSLYESYVDRVYGYIAARVRNPIEAEDLTEQVFLKALESLDSYQWRGAPFGAWLFRIASNLVVDYVRQSSRRQTLPLEEAIAKRDVDLSPESAVEKKLATQEVSAAVEHLTHLQQQVIRLKFGGDLNNAEVAAVLNKSVGAVKDLQHSAINSLRRLLLNGKPAKLNREKECSLELKTRSTTV